MNNERRKAIRNVIQAIEDAKVAIEQALEEERDYFDTMPESFQSGEKGMAAETAAENLESVLDDLDNAIRNADEACR